MDFLSKHPLIGINKPPDVFVFEYISDFNNSITQNFTRDRATASVRSNPALRFNTVEVGYIGTELSNYKMLHTKPAESDEATTGLRLAIEWVEYMKQVTAGSSPQRSLSMDAISKILEANPFIVRLNSSF